MKHFCSGCNTEPSEDGESPWVKSFGKGEFKGKKRPFGALVDFMPHEKTRKKALGKFEQRV